MSILTAIIPIDLSYRAPDIIEKAKRIIECAQKNNFLIRFGHNDQGTAKDREFKNLVSRHECCHNVSAVFYTEKINTSVLRNRAFDGTETEFLILLDVDIWPDYSIIEKYLNNLVQNQSPFEILPCLYLTKFGSKALTTSKASISELKEKFFNYSRKEFLHLASPSSITLLRSIDYERIGGFDEDYAGHGYEDFDFLIRLADAHNMLAAGRDFLHDRSARSPLFSVGFRRSLGELCIHKLIEKDFVFHIYHEKSNPKDYSNDRLSNYNIFKQKHAHRTSEWSPPDLTLISSFANTCQAEKHDIHNLSILYDNKPGHIDRFDTFKRRLRFLIND